MNETSCLVICVLETTNVERPLKAHSLKLDETGKFLNFAMFRMGNFRKWAMLMSHDGKPNSSSVGYKGKNGPSVATQFNVASNQIYTQGKDCM